MLRYGYRRTVGDMHIAKAAPRAVALIAALLVLGAASYAAAALPKNSVGTKQLKKNSVGTKQLKNGAVTASFLIFAVVTEFFLSCFVPTLFFGIFSAA